MVLLLDSRSRRQHDAKRYASPAEQPKKSPNAVLPPSRSLAAKFSVKRYRFKTVFNREANQAKAQLVHVLQNILSKRGEDVGQLSTAVKGVDLYWKAADVLTEYSQKTSKQDAQIKQQQSDYEKKCEQLKESHAAQREQDQQLKEISKTLLSELDSLNDTLKGEKGRCWRLENELETLRERVRFLSLEQCETKHSLTAELQECHARSREENQLAASLLLQLAEKDATIEKLQLRLGDGSANAEQFQQLQQESSFLHSVLCEAYEKIQDFLVSQEASIEEATHSLKVATQTIDETLEAEREFQHDKKLDAEHLLPFVRVKRER